MSRRHFLRSSAAIAAFAALPAFAAANLDFSQGRTRRVGLIGCGWYGKSDLWRLVQVTPVEIVALCDPDKNLLAGAVEIASQRQKSKKRPPTYTDYRQMLKQHEFDIVLVGSKGKISNEQPYSLTFSVIAEAQPSLTFKLLIQKDASEHEYAQILEAFLDFLAAFHSGSLDDGMLQRLQTSRVVGGTLLFAFNLESKILETLDPIPKREPPNEA